MNQAPFISVIVPVYNGAHFLDRCLSGLRTSSYTDYELIVMDDASTDSSGDVARSYGAQVLKMPRQSGPGAARNMAAREARGEIVFFVDADVVVAPDAIQRVADNFTDYPEIAAVFGSYDDNPAEQNFLSQYKNLCHHFVHQQGHVEAITFWGGCGAVRRDVFLAVGGFDSMRFPRPSIEDIELGYRLHAQGHRIRLDKKLQGKHLKCWKLVSWLRADIRDRAVPWSLLIFESGTLVNDLNLKISDRVSAVCALLSITLLPASLIYQPLILAALLSLYVMARLNRPLFRFFAARRGWLFALATLPPQVLYYCYSSITFALCWSWYVTFGKSHVMSATPTTKLKESDLKAVASRLPESGVKSSAVEPMA